MSQKRNLIPSLTINNWDGNITGSTTQSGLSQHLLDAHRMAREGQILRHRTTNLTDRATMTALILCQLLSWSLRSWGENGRGEMMRGGESMGKRFPQLYYNNFSIIYTFHRQHILRQQLRSWWKVFLPPVLLFYHFPTSASCLITTYTRKRLQGSNQTRSHFSFRLLAAISMTRR